MRAIRRLTTLFTALTLTAALPAVAAIPLTEMLGGGHGEVNWTSGTLTVTGSGSPPDRGPLGTRRLLAERAAVVDGYRQLAELIHGVRVDAETVVKDFTLESDTIRTQVSALVRGAERVDTRYLADGAVEVDLQVRLHGPSSLFAAVEFNRKIANPAAKPAQQPPTAVDAPVTAPPADEKPVAVETPPPAPKAASVTAPGPADPRSGKAYTGVIVDCREVGLQPAMSPTILDEQGQELYVGHLPIDADHVINVGIVGYATGLEEAKAAKDRVGDHPLVIKAKKAQGSYKADVVLSNADARTLLDAANGTNLLTQSRVMFVLKP